MKSLILTSILFWALASLLHAQNSSLFMSGEYQRAYKNETRSATGYPGNNYWVNSTDYKLYATIHPDEAKLEGHAQIMWHNNSPDTIKFLVLKLKQNVFKKGNPKNNPIPVESLNDGVLINNLQINQQLVNTQEPRRIIEMGTLYGIRLKPEEYLAPGHALDVSADWEFSIPEQQFRTGKIHDSSFFVGYWFPQVAVKDDVFGYDFINYDGQHETYNDISNIYAEIKVPGNYFTWATGDLVNENEIYGSEILQRIDKSKQSQEIVSIIGADDLGRTDLLLQKDTLVWKFDAREVPDFAFAISPNYLWDAGLTKSNHKNHEYTWVNVVYPTDASLYNMAAKVAQKAIDYFSNTFPAVPFPYSKFTTVYSRHGLGMEFPMMANDGNVRGDTSLLVDVISHEIAHTYFPMLVNTNEKMFAWMDEGWTTVFGDKMVEFMGYEPPQIFHRMNTRTWNTIYDLPLMVPTTQINNEAWYHHYYVRSRHADLFLLDIFKEKGIDNPVKKYIETWTHKHPMPYDFFNIMNEQLGEDLTWYWKPWYFEYSTPDLAIGSVNSSQKTNEITILNPGKLPCSFMLQVTFKDGTTQDINKSAYVWKENLNTCKVSFKNKIQLQNVVVSIKGIPDSSPDNNLWKALE